jgi:hypothetical protein|tara:strand:+ start:3071 stop:3487 length:417 start_codon:yes stop_codon:yes gene_type:complete
VEKEKRKKLKQLADRTLNQLEIQDELKRIAESDPVQGARIRNTINGIIDNVSNDYIESTKGDKFRSKLQSLKDIVLDNIELSKDLNNFDTESYIKDKKFINDMIFNYEAIDKIYTKEKIRMNDIYKEHKKINSFLKTS